MKKLIFISVLLFICILTFYALFIAKSSKKEQLPTQPQVATPTPFQIPTVFIREGGGLEPDDFKRDEREFIEQTPVLQKLPGGDSIFSIRYINEQHLIVFAKIPDKEFAYEEAKKKLTENGIDINTIIIEYR